MMPGDIGLKSLRLNAISGIVEMPEASKSNIHGPIHGISLVCLVNTGGIEGIR
jgi:hypothetical protein